MKEKTKETSQKRPKALPVIVGGKVIDLHHRKYAWLKGFDYYTQLYILSGMLRD